MTAAGKTPASYGTAVLSNAQACSRTAAGPGGDPAPSGSGRVQHDWTDWVDVADVHGLGEAVSERSCNVCGSEQIASTDSLISVSVLRPFVDRVERAVA